MSMRSLQVKVLLALCACGLGGWSLFISLKESNAEVRHVRAELKLLASSACTQLTTGSCPTVADAAKRSKTRTKTTDPWHMPYRIACSEKSVRVASPGPDGKHGTADDIHYQQDCRD